MLQPEDVGAVLRRLRGSRSPRDVAEAAEISTSMLAHYEAGRQMPSRKVLDRLAETLGVPEAELDRRVLSAWQKRLDESFPESRQVLRQELLEHVQAIGTHLTLLVSKLEELTPRRDRDAEEDDDS